MASDKGVDFTTYPRDEPTENPKAEAGCSSSSLKEDQSPSSSSNPSSSSSNPRSSSNSKAEAGCSSSSLKEDQSRSSSSNPKAEAGCSSSSFKEDQSRSSSLKTKRKNPSLSGDSCDKINGSKTVAQESYSAESINSTHEFKKQKVLGYGCNDGEGEREALAQAQAQAQAGHILEDGVAVSLAALVTLSNQAAARAGTLLERVPSLMRSLNTQASESQEQLATAMKARLDSEAKLAEVLKKNQELQHALDDSLLKNKKLEEDFNAQVATLSKERDAEREQAIFLCRGLAKAVRSSMESAGAVMLDTVPDYRSPEEWARLAEQYLKYLDDIGKASSKSFAVTAVMACAATVAVGLKDTSLDTATACLQAGFPQNAFSAVCGKQQALKTAAENFVYVIAKTIEAAKNQNNGESC